MDIINKKNLAILTSIPIIAATALFLSGFLCFEGLLSGIIFYCSNLAIIAIYTKSSFLENTKLKKYCLDASIVIPLFYIFIMPIGMLIKSDVHGGFDFFLTERLYQYIYLECIALLILILFSTFYAKEKSQDIGELKTNLSSILSIALIVRIFWMIVFETRHLRDFAVTMPQLKVEYVVLVSIPLFVGILILTMYKSRVGYVLGFISGLAHVILTCLMVSIGQNPGVGPIVVIFISLAICIFSVKKLMENVQRDGEIPKVAFFIMRQVLKLRRNPKRIQQRLEHTGIKENMKVLDFGCGIGNYTIEAAKIVGKSGTIIAVDVNDGMIQEVEKEINKNELTNVKTQLINYMGDIEENNFDFVLLIDVIHLIDDKTEIIEHLLNKLTTNGKLLIKFEHINKDMVDSILKKCKCSEKTLVFPNKKYWVLGK